MWTKWARLWARVDNQEVGLEAAILERVRNSSLVEGVAAPTIHRGSSLAPTLWMHRKMRGRGASHAAVKVARKQNWSAWECECRHE